MVGPCAFFSRISSRVTFSGKTNACSAFCRFSGDGLASAVRVNFTSTLLRWSDIYFSDRTGARWGAPFRKAVPRTATACDVQSAVSADTAIASPNITPPADYRLRSAAAHAPPATADITPPAENPASWTAACRDLHDALRLNRQPCRPDIHRAAAREGGKREEKCNSQCKCCSVPNHSRVHDISSKGTPL